MARSYHKARAAVSLISHGYVGVLLEELKRELASEETSYAFRRDLSLPFETRRAALLLTVRPFAKRDIGVLAIDSVGHAVTKALVDRVSRVELIEAGIPTCYVAVAPDGSPCFLQWLISPTSNNRLIAYYKGYFPPLAEDEVLLEGAFVPEQYRGKGIMPHAMSEIARKGRDLGARWAVTYVEASNIPSIRGCLACGFHPYLRKKAVWRAFRRKVSFTPLSDGERERLETAWRAPGGPA